MARLGSFLFKAAVTGASAVGTAAVVRAKRNDEEINERIAEAMESARATSETLAPPPPGPTGVVPGAAAGIIPGAAAGAALAAGANAGRPPPDDGVQLWPAAAAGAAGGAVGAAAVGAAAQTGPVVPVMDAEGPEGAGTQAARTGAYASMGTAFGIALGALTAAVLVFAIVVAVLERDDTSGLTAASSRAAQEDAADGSSDFDTSGSSGNTDASAAPTDTGPADTGGDTGASSGGGGDAGGGGEEAAAAGPTGIPPEGRWPATGSGSEQTKTNITTLGAQWENMSLSIIHDGDGCWFSRYEAHSGRASDVRMCRTGDGGIINTQSKTWSVVDLQITQERNLSTVTCEPPNVYLSGAPEAGQGLQAGNCVGANEECTGGDINGFTGCKTSTKASQKTPFANSVIKVIGQEQVAGQDAWHVRIEQQMVPEDPNSAGWTQSFPPHNSEDWWFRVSDGLTVQYARETNTKILPAGSLGDLTGETVFTEAGTMTIVL